MISSNSSMVDSNIARHLLAIQPKSVQIPLWSIVTAVFEVSHLVELKFKFLYGR